MTNKSALSFLNDFFKSSLKKVYNTRYTHNTTHNTQSLLYPLLQKPYFPNFFTITHNIRILYTQWGKTNDKV